MCVIKCQIICIWFWGNYNFSTFANISSRALCHSLYSIMVSQTLYSLCLFCLKFTNLSTSRPRQKPSKRQMMTQWGHCITFCVVVIDDRGQGGGCDLLLCNHIGGCQKVTFLSGILSAILTMTLCRILHFIPTICVRLCWNFACRLFENVETLNLRGRQDCCYIKCSIHKTHFFQTKNIDSWNSNCLAINNTNVLNLILTYIILIQFLDSAKEIV